MNIKPYVYHITFTPTGERYVGSRRANKVNSKEDFWNIYFTHSDIVKDLIEKYGVESFKTDWITEYEDGKQAVDAEVKFQKENDVIYNDLYLNGCIFPYFDNTGIVRSKETREKMSVAAKIRESQMSEEKKKKRNKKISEANSGKVLSEEEKKHLSEVLTEKYKERNSDGKCVNHPNYGRKASEETRKKMSELHKGEKNYWYGKKLPPHVVEKMRNRVITEETKKKMSEAAKNKPPISEETREKMSESNKGEKNGFYGKKHSNESIKKMSEASKGNQIWLGRKHSPESIKKMSESKMGYMPSDETRKKMSEMFSGEGNPMHGKSNKWGKHSPETKKKMSEAVQRRLEYKNWNEYYGLT